MRSGATRRARGAAVVLAASVVASLVATSPARAEDEAPPTTVDAQLAHAVSDAASAAEEVRVEIVTGDTAGAARELRSLGAIVTGAVPGELVQASVPAGAVDDVVPPSGGHLQLPRRVNRAPAALGRTDLGPVAGQNIAVTNVGAWHDAGVRGAVKVGVIDFFDLGLWNPAEHGTFPDAAHQFCKDTSGIAPSYCPMRTDGINDGGGEEHGIAVVEVLKDAAPDAEIYVATAATTADMRDAISWFAANGVRIVSRSLGAPYDGPGDGTGPLAAVVDHAASLGITWFNSAGNDAVGSYGRYTNGVAPDGYVDFDNGPGVDTTLTLTGSCMGFDGVRWNDWGEGSGTTDYRMEIADPIAGNVGIAQVNQAAGAPPLELVDEYICSLAGQITLRMRRVATGGDPTPDVIELALFNGRIETGRSQAEFSAAKSVVDSRNPALVAVGAIDPPSSGTIGFYSSQGPTNDGRIKPDVVGPSCLSSSIYRPAIYGPGACFNGTSASAPAVAGLAAVLLARRLATSGANLAALTEHLVVDLGAPGADNAYGRGLVRLPSVPPTSIDNRPAQYFPLAAPRRILDTRPISPTPGAQLGPFAPLSIVDLSLAGVTSPSGAPVTAVAVSITSVDSAVPGYVQALPMLIGELGGFANLNVGFAGQIKPNLAVVPLGAGGAISLFLPAGGNVVVDLMGTYSPAIAPAVSAGRYVPLDPTRVLDTRPGTLGPVPPEWSPHKPGPGETVRITAVPPGAAAVVLNVTAAEADGPGFLRSQPTGATGLTTANGNYVPGVASGTLTIVPVAAPASGGDGTVSIFTSNSTHIVADLVGWFTDGSAAPSAAGLFVPITPGRGYDSRFHPAGAHAAGSVRTVPLAGAGLLVPPGASGVSLNIAADGAESEGFLAAYPAGAARPLISTLNYPSLVPISNAAMPRLAPSGAIDVNVNRTTHVIIDVNGYFTGPA